jgi:aldose 1-epimerase
VRKPASTFETCRLEDDGVAIWLLNYGAITQGWWVPCQGTRVPVVLGYEDLARYRQDEAYLGAIVGRIANRTAGGRLVLGEERYQLTQNEGVNHLHGGTVGLHRRLWTMERDTANQSVRLSCISADGEEGYPGEARISVTVSLRGNAVTYDMQAVVDRPTPINLAQHNYYNLMGEGTIWSHHLTSIADRMTPTGEGNIPTGAIAPVDGSRVDFRNGATFQEADPRHEGTDINLVLPENRDPAAPIAEVRAPNGLRLRMWSDQPGLQLYTGGALQESAGAHGSQSIARFAAFCLEPQGFPNAVNTPEFPSILVTPDAPYRQKTTVEIVEVAP